MKLVKFLTSVTLAAASSAAFTAYGSQNAVIDIGCRHRPTIVDHKGGLYDPSFPEVPISNQGWGTILGPPIQPIEDSVQDQTMSESRHLPPLKVAGGGALGRATSRFVNEPWEGRSSQDGFEQIKA